MPYDAAYATAVQYRAVTDLLDTSNDAIIERHLLTCSRYLDAEAGQWFGKDDAPVLRQFYSDGTSLLRLDAGGCPGIATETGLVVTQGTADEVITTGVVLQPLNSLLKPDPTPYRSMFLPSAYAAGTIVKVTAVWGYPAVPSRVVDTTIELAAIWRAESPRATARMNELSELVSSSPMAMSLVKKFKSSVSRMRVA